MPVAIDATVGGASANSFATLAEFTAYMDGRLNAGTFTAASDDDKNRALVEATRELTILSWEGLVVTTTQALTWPRQSAVNPDSPTLDYFAIDVIPQRVKDACLEMAFQFLKAGTTDVAAEAADLGITEKTVDVLTTRYDPRIRNTGLRRYPRAYDRIRPLLGIVAGVRSVVRA